MVKNEKEICNLCGRELDFWDLNEDILIEKPHLGYGSSHDGSPLRLRLCCRCLDELIDACTIPPVED